MKRERQTNFVSMWINVQPGKKTDEVVAGVLPHELLVRVKEHAREGKANKAVREVLARHFGIASSRVIVVKGQRSKRKLVKMALSTEQAVSCSKKGAS